MHEGIDSYNDYRLYCFDLDDTLVDTFRHVAKVLYPRLGKRSGLRIPGPDEIRRHWGGRWRTPSELCFLRWRILARSWGISMSFTWRTQFLPSGMRSRS